MDISRSIVVQEVITRVLKGKDYRIVTQTEINSKFLEYCLNFFKKVVTRKLEGGIITKEWYKENFVQNDEFNPAERAIFAGINKKTITNMFDTGKKEIVIDAAEENYDNLVNAITKLLDEETELDLKLIIKFKEVAIELNLNESLVFITSLAVKRAAITGGSYSQIGKNVEGPLMLTLCKLFKVEPQYYALRVEGVPRPASYEDFNREIDFYLKNDDTTLHKCEVKLMGKGNPEVADAVIARESRVFVADKLSETNKRQLNHLGVSWTALRSVDDKNYLDFTEDEGYLRFYKTLESLDIPFTMHNPENLEEDLRVIFEEIFV